MQRVLRMFSKMAWLLIGFVGGYLSRPHLEDKVNSITGKITGK